MISFVPGYFGFLGNELFQYATTLALARRRGVEFVWPYGKHIPAVGVQAPGTIFRERQFHFDPAVMDLPDDTILWGYFQSEKYFADAESEIRRLFPLRGERDRAVSIHVRRGDYLSFPEHHPPLPVDYYRQAMAQFPYARFRVFSDDPGWCLLNLKPLADDVEIITGNEPKEDMGLMALCGGGHIIANSSFSWWGAYLDPNPDKKVIVPGGKFPWFGPAKAGWSTKDLLPESWIKL